MSCKEKDVALIGFMGCGKSSVGKCLAALLPECRLIDLDTYIEEKESKNIPEIFNEYGEAAFRRMEREALEEIFSDRSRPRAIIALGGGTVISEPCRQLIHRHTDCFYLRATTDTLLANLEGHSEGRPMLKPIQMVRFDKLSDRMGNHTNNHTMVAEPAEVPSTEASKEREALRNRIESLMRVRSPQYLATAHHTIDIDGRTFDQIAALIKETVERNSLNIKR